MVYRNKMAKNLIEKSPIDDILVELMNGNLFDIRCMQKYGATDAKGRYLYWDKFKWQIDKEDNPKKAWFAVKSARDRLMKRLDLLDKQNKPFSFCIPDTLQAKLYKVSELSRRGIVPHDTVKGNYLLSSLMMEESISSSQLEGASTTRKIAKALLVSDKKPKNEDEEMIVNNYLLMKEVKRVRYDVLSIDMILEFHRIATHGNTDNGNIEGTFRTNDDIVITDGLEDNILHQPPKYKELVQRIATLCDFANTNHSGENDTIFIDPIVKAILLHFMVGYIHPFADGNGRTARALFYWYMLKNDFNYFEYISISKLLKVAPKQYSMSYLYSEVDDNDVTYFIEYQLTIILRAIDELLEYLENKSIEYEEVSEILKDSTLNQSLNFVQKDIIQKAIKNPGRIFTALEIRADYGIAPTTARKYLKELAEHKILVYYKDGKTIAYIAPENLHDILKKAN